MLLLQAFQCTFSHLHHRQPRDEYDAPLYNFDFISCFILLSSSIHSLDPLQSSKMPPMPQSAMQGQGPSTFDKMKMGAIMGVTVGCCVGILFGGFNALRYGPGPNGFLRYIGQNMAASAAMFGGFMSIGSVIRTEGNMRVINERWMNQRIAWDAQRKA